MTLSCASATINFNPGGAGCSVSGGGLTYGAVTTNSGISLNQSNTFSSFTANPILATGTKLQFAASQTITGTFTFNGPNATTGRGAIFSATLGSQITITASTVVITNADLRDINGAGAASWNLSAITGNSGDCGGNSGITFTTPISCYLKTAVSVNYSASNWFTTSGGSTSARVPLPQDTVVIDSNSVTTAGKTISFDMPRIGSLHSSAVINSPQLSMTASGILGTPEIYGDFLLGSGTTIGAASNVINLLGRSSYSITTNSVSVSLDLRILSIGGTYTITDNFTMISAPNGFWLGSGTLTASNINVTVPSFQCVSLGGTQTSGWTVNMGTGTWTVSGTGTIWSIIFSNSPSPTINASTSTILISNTSSSTKTFISSPNSHTYNNIHVNGASSNGTVTFDGTFSTLDANTFTFDANSSIVWKTGSNYNFNSLVCSGSAGNLVTFATNSSGTAASLNCTNPVDVDYMSIKDSTATGNTPFYAGTHSTNVSGNTAWSFITRPTYSVNAIFFAGD